MRDYTRRRLLTQVIPGLALAALLPACGRTVIGTPTMAATIATPSVATPTAPPATMTATPQPRRFRSADACAGLIVSGAQNSEEPFRNIGYFDVTLGPVPFATNVQAADTIMLVTVRDILPARWATFDGGRPSSPHLRRPSAIVTPLRLSIERALGKETAWQECYTLIWAGRVGDECQASVGNPPWGLAEAFVGDRFFYFFQGMLTPTNPIVDLAPLCQPFVWYPVRVDSTITVFDRFDVPLNSPQRILTVDEALREIAALLAQPGATPTR